MAGSTGSLRPVPAIDKAARVLRAIAEGGRAMGISELARSLNVSKGTLRDLLLTLDAGAHSKVLDGREDIGYDDQELFRGVRAVAAPITDANGKRIAVLMVVGFKERVDLRTLRKIGERCASAAAELSRRLGAPQRGQRVERPP